MVCTLILRCEDRENDLRWDGRRRLVSSLECRFDIRVSRNVEGRVAEVHLTWTLNTCSEACEQGNVISE